MYDFIVVGAGISGVSFAYKTSKYAKTLLVEAQDYEREIPVRTNIQRGRTIQRAVHSPSSRGADRPAAKRNGRPISSSSSHGP